MKNIFEYIDFCREQYNNQGWVFNDQGELIKEKGNYYSLSMPKKNYNVNEVISLKITYKSFFINSNFFICLSPKIDKNFCNLNTTKLDTIYSNNKDVDINLTFSNKGNKNLRGFIREYYYKETDTINPVERFIYLDIPIKVE